MPTINISYTMTPEKAQALLTALGYQNQVQNGVDENGVPIMVANPVTKKQFFQEEIKDMLKERFANDEILRIEQNYRLQIETEKQAVLDDIDSSTTVNLV